jgi:hypothetical protein
MKAGEMDVRELWAGLSEGERRLIASVMGMLKGARRSQIREVARAAAKWESGIGFFIKVRLMHEKPARRVDRGWLKVEGKRPATSCQSGGRN